MSWLSSAMTKPGQNASDARNKHQSEAEAFLIKLLRGNPDLLQHLLGQQSQIADLTFGGLQDLLANTGASARKSRVASFGATADANAAKSTRDVGLTGKSMGLGDGLLGGAALSAQNQAATQKNQDYNYENSPQKMSSDFMSGLQGVQGWEGIGAAPGNTLQNAIQQILGLQPLPVGPGLGDFLGQVAGSYATGGFK
jgi:hypothetical protein